MTDPEINAHRNPLRLWRSLAQRPGGRTDVVSVGVNSKTADSVLATSGEVRLLTRLRVLDFVTGESNLRCLRRLVSNGVSVFHHPEIEANIVISRGLTASLGSRGLQAARSSARHLTWSTEAETTVKETQDLVDSWFADAEPVTLELIDELEWHIRSQNSQFKKSVRSADEIDKKIEAGKPEREAQRKQRDRDRRRREDGVERFITAAELAAAPSETKFCAHRYIAQQEFGVWFGHGNHTLLHDESELLVWHYGEEEIDLRKAFRYLFVIPELGRIGWARVMKTRITKVGSGIRKSGVTFVGRRYDVTYEADWGNALANISVRLQPSSVTYLSEPATVHGFFSINGLEIVSIGGHESEAEFLRDQADELSAQITRDLLKPFQYQTNLFGEEMDGFLHPGLYQWWQLRLGKLQGEVFIVGEVI